MEIDRQQGCIQWDIEDWQSDGSEMMLLKKWTTKIVKLSDAVPQKNNSRIIDPASLNGLKASIGRFGLVELIVWNERTRHIISGHQRYAILQQRGIQEVPMIVVDMTPEEESAASLTMNNPKIEGEFDEPVMELLGQVENAAPDLFKAVRMDELKESLERNIQRSGDRGSGEENAEEWDTECPCCNHKWKVESGNILVVKGVV
jgi:hypothetical protein